MNGSNTRPPQDRPPVPLTWAEQDRFLLLMLRAAVPGRTRRYTVRRRDRLRQSPFADDLRRAYRSVFWPAVVASGLLVGVVVINVLAAGGFVDWTGFHPIPTEAGTR